MAEDPFITFERGFSLNEALEMLAASDTDEETGEIEITALPPATACDTVTDEDSGGEENPLLDNLPGSQLCSNVEVSGKQISHSVSKNPSKQKKSYHWSEGDIVQDDSEWPLLQMAKNSLTPEQLFYLFFDDEVVSLMTTYTNQYAAKKNQSGDITETEMRCFIAVLLLSGYVDLPRKNMFWECSPDTHNPLVSNAISRDRFKFIMGNIHVCNNDNLDKSDKFAKVRPLFTELNKRLLLHTPHCENHSIDETMVPYFGKHGCKQFIKGKPIRYGYKLWTGATSSGYIVWTDPYQGANTVAVPEYKDLGLGASVVLQYVDVLSNIGPFKYHVFTDNFFTSLLLLAKLRERNIKGTGTIRENRVGGCPLTRSEALKKTARGTSETKVEKTNNIVLTKWNDNRVVTVASNSVPASPVHHVSRYSQKQKKRIRITQPHNIHVYNQYMGGVDRADQNISLYRTSIRGKKWYFSLIAHCIDVAEQNAWQLHRQSYGELDHLSFRRRLAISVLEQNATPRKSKGRPSKNEHQDSRFDRKDHWIVPQDKQTRCRMCHAKTTTRCFKCDVGVHVKCFKDFHTVK